MNHEIIDYTRFNVSTIQKSTTQTNAYMSTDMNSDLNHKINSIYYFIIGLIICALLILCGCICCCCFCLKRFPSLRNTGQVVRAFFSKSSGRPSAQYDLRAELGISPINTQIRLSKFMDTNGMFLGLNRL
jgi:hypothetical protein